MDEHWDGKGFPNQLAGEQIPLQARIVNLSQMLEIFATVLGVNAAYTMARRHERLDGRG